MQGGHRGGTCWSGGLSPALSLFAVTSPATQNEGWTRSARPSSEGTWSSAESVFAGVDPNPGQKKSHCWGRSCQGILKRAAGDGDRGAGPGWSVGQSPSGIQARKLTTLYIRTGISSKGKMEEVSQL